MCSHPRRRSRCALLDTGQAKTITPASCKAARVFASRLDGIVPPTTGSYQHGARSIVGSKQEWVVVDTGTAVIQRKASGSSKLPVLDLFFKCEKDYEKARLPKYAVVEVSK